jgi:hypothetical protein
MNPAEILAARPTSERTEKALHTLQKHSMAIDSYFCGIALDEYRLNRISEGAEEVCSKLTTLELCLKSQEVTLGLYDAVRHMLKLIDVSFGLFGDVSGVADAREAIRSAIREKFGQKQAEMLEMTLAYL